MKFIISLILVIFLFNCSAESNKTTIMTTCFPVYSIVKELVGNNVIVEILVPATVSPHTYSPKPTDIKKSNMANVFISIADNYDGWSKTFQTKRHIQLIEFLPDSLKIYFGENFLPHTHDDGHNHTHSKDELDPHFWLDPLTVKAILPNLADTLSIIFPELKNQIKNNANNFSKRLDLIHKETLAHLRNVNGQGLFLQHPSFLYFANRYGLDYLGAIEESPGKEPGPRFLSELIKKIKQSGVQAIFTEPQLNKKAAEIIAKEANVLLYEIDPVGNIQIHKNYSDLILKNAKIISKALSK